MAAAGAAAGAPGAPAPDLVEVDDPAAARDFGPGAAVRIATTTTADAGVLRAVAEAGTVAVVAPAALPAALAAGVASDRIAVDIAADLDADLVATLRRLRDEGPALAGNHPVVVTASDPAAVALAICLGARVIRTEDVAAATRVRDTLAAIMAAP